jgi:hypothetical protein
MSVETDGGERMRFACADIATCSSNKIPYIVSKRVRNVRSWSFTRKESGVSGAPNNNGVSRSSVGRGGARPGFGGKSPLRLYGLAQVGTATQGCHDAFSPHVDDTPGPAQCDNR